MANAEMYDYLETIIADDVDYTATTLSVTPTTILPFDSDKAQDIHEMDSGAVIVVTKSDQSYFDITLEWDNISASDHGIIFDFYNSTTKANAREFTFYWEHPTDEHTYVARFMSKLTSNYIHKYGARMKVNQIKLRIEGRKADA